MKLENTDIIIKDWAGNDLFIGPVNDPTVGDIIDANNPDDIFVQWVDETREENVFEYI